jgi:hypothetical protein
MSLFGVVKAGSRLLAGQQPRKALLCRCFQDGGRGGGGRGRGGGFYGRRQWDGNFTPDAVGGAGTPPLLHPETKDKLYFLYKEDPEEYTVSALAKKFSLSQARIRAIIQLKDREAEAQASGRFGTEVEEEVLRMYGPSNPPGSGAAFDARDESSDVPLGRNFLVLGDMEDEEERLRPFKEVKTRKLAKKEKQEAEAQRAFEQSMAVGAERFAPGEELAASDEQHTSKRGHKWMFCDISAGKRNDDAIVRDDDGALRRPSRAELESRSWWGQRRGSRTRHSGWKVLDDQGSMSTAGDAVAHHSA